VAANRIELAQAEVGATGNPALVPLTWEGLLWSPALDGKGGFSCTAQFITDRVVLTAAHCVRDRYSGQYYDVDNKKSFFALQYQNDQASRYYHPLCKATWPGWVVSLKPGEDPNNNKSLSKETSDAIDKSWQWDYAFIYLDGSTITGHYDYDHDFANWNGARSTGYPGKLVGGEVIQTAWGEIFDPSAIGWKTPNIRGLWHGNPQFTQGASGGAWVVNFRGDPKSPDSNKIVGLNSFDNTGKPGVSFGPRFTDRFSKLLDFVAGGCKAQ
jgi:hypothetical protein